MLDKNTVFVTTKNKFKEEVKTKKFVIKNILGIHCVFKYRS